MKNTVNIINFVRQCEPRQQDNEFLFDTTKKELELCRQFGFPSTVLLQYDAIIDEKYINLLNEFKENTEIGLWLEIVKPLCEAVGIEWKGRYPWDWRNDVGFSVGYTPEEREKLIDEAFCKFKDIFGYYPDSCGSWHIDAHSLKYMYEKYNIKASCNCKEQYGTDGYTLWGGIYSGGYYPSKNNVLCPAATKERQIDVPVFRMLGADPIYQYDMNLGEADMRQKVISLEPVYDNSGANKEWVRWYLSENFNMKGISLSYAQTGQENSMGWEDISKGLPFQFEVLKEMQSEGKISIECLRDTGIRFKNEFEFTPPQAQMFDNDIKEKYKTVWYNCKNYRINFLYENGYVKIRDMYLFDENFEEEYLRKKDCSHNCSYFNLPVIDGYRFSDKDTKAGIYFRRHGHELQFSSVWRSFVNKNSANIYLDDELKITASEDFILIKSPHINWYMQAVTAKDSRPPYLNAENKTLKMRFSDENFTAEFDYELQLEKGYFKNEENGFLIFPEDGEIKIVTASK